MTLNFSVMKSPSASVFSVFDHLTMNLPFSTPTLLFIEPGNSLVDSALIISSTVSSKVNSVIKPISPVFLPIATGTVSSSPFFAESPSGPLIIGEAPFISELISALQPVRLNAVSPTLPVALKAYEPSAAAWSTLKVTVKG